MDTRVGALAGLHILVVEDNRDARQIFRAMLTHFGALVTVVETAARALTQLRESLGVPLTSDVKEPNRA